MKTLKYRTILSTLMVAGLSVFLFTACEKDTDESTAPNAPDKNMFDKFKRLVFSGGEATATTNSGSGTFIGGSSGLTFDGGDGMGVKFDAGADATLEFSEGGNTKFTNPRSYDGNFVVNGMPGIGGGSFSLGSESFDLDFGFCASVAMGGHTSLPNDTFDVDLFVGIQGVDGDDWADTSYTEKNFLYVISYDGVSEIGDFDSYYNNSQGIYPLGAYVILVTLEKSNGGQYASTYFGTSGTVDFDGSNATLRDVTLQEVFENELDSTGSVTLSADIECVTYDSEEE